MANTKKRNGWLTAWLILIIIVNAVNLLVYSSGAASQTLETLPGWFTAFAIILSVFNLICIIALFWWKRWGFWGLCASSVILFVVNISMGEVGLAVASLLGLLILYGLLHAGDKDKGWPQLE